MTTPTENKLPSVFDIIQQISLELGSKIHEKISSGELSELQKFIEKCMERHTAFHLQRQAELYQTLTLHETNSIQKAVDFICQKTPETERNKEFNLLAENLCGAWTKIIMNEKIAKQYQESI